MGGTFDICSRYVKCYVKSTRVSNNDAVNSTSVSTGMGLEAFYFASTIYADQ